MIRIFKITFNVQYYWYLYRGLMCYDTFAHLSLFDLILVVVHLC